jgi:hypothetical protein
MNQAALTDSGVRLCKTCGEPLQPLHGDYFCVNYDCVRSFVLVTIDQTADKDFVPFYSEPQVEQKEPTDE